MAMARYIPITRSHRSFFDPSWEVGTWHDFGSAYKRMEEHMRQMNKHIDDMFRRFEVLMPIPQHILSMPRLPAPSMQVPSLTGPSNFGAPAPLRPPMEMPALPPMTMASQWRMENPIVTEADGSRRVKLEFDVRQFKPEEITVTTQDNMLTVHGRHAESGPQNSCYREYNRQFLLPPTVHLETLSSVLSPEGVLTVTAGLPPAARAIEPSRERIIPIEYKPQI